MPEQATAPIITAATEAGFVEQALAIVRERAIIVFDTDFGEKWITIPSRYFHNMAPQDYVRDEETLQAVLTHINHFANAMI